ncbi:MAG: alpha-glucosidase [Eubacteriales bacterium]|nr:alpha-glucosidase [Eubacteriales bacterium]
MARTYWWKEAVIYEIYMKSFKDTDGDGIGDIRGVIEKLPYLKELGINCIWFTPIYPSPQVDNGYDVADYYGINEAYGGMDAFKELLSKAHALGIRIVMDMVLNHSSDECLWFKEARKSKDNPYRDYYIWGDPKEDGSEPCNWANCFNDGNGSAWTYTEETGQYYFHNYSYKMPELNWKSEKLREEVYSMMRGWLALGVDGFRLDVINRIKKPDAFHDLESVNSLGYAEGGKKQCSNVPGFEDIIHDIAENTWLLPQYDAFSMGECGGVTSENALRYLDPEKRVLDTLYHFEIVSRKKEISLRDYKRIEAGWASLMEKGVWPIQHLGNHDQPRLVSKFGDDSTEELRIRSARCLALLTYMMPGTPIIYQGDEIGMVNTYFDNIKDYNDRYTVGDYMERRKAGMTHAEALFPIRMASRDNARTPMLWDSSKNAGFTEGTPWIKVNNNYPRINAELDRSKPEAESVFRFYQKLISMRKEHPAVINGDFTMYLPDDDHFVVFTRHDPQSHEILLVIANASSEAAVLPEIPEPAVSQKNHETLISTTGNDFEIDKDCSSPRTFLPWEAYVLKI